VNILLDILAVIENHGRLLSGVLLMMLLSQNILSSVLRLLFGSRLSAGEYFSLSIAGWIFPLSLASVLWLVFGAVPVFALMVLLAILLFLRARRISVAGSKSIFPILLALFGLFVLLRLPFVAEAILPQYFDSAQHYLTIKNLLRGLDANPTSLHWPTPSYYHIGFHLLSAFITSSLRVEITHVMLIVGQMIVVTIPFPVFFLVRHATRSSEAGLFALLLAGFGWYMPAYTVNWGKYPALTSLSLIAFILSLAYLAIRYRSVLSPGKYAGVVLLLLSGMLITVFVHSRTLIIFGMMALTWLTLSGWYRLPKVPQVLSFCALLAGILLEINYIRTKDVLGPLFDPYWDKGLLITSLVLILAIFALRAYPRLTFAILLSILFLLGAMFIPIAVPGYGNLTFLDRPFVEMMLYLPLSMLGGAGLAGLEQSLRLMPARWQFARLGAGSVLSGALLVNALLNYTLYPSDCCSIVSRDDLVAIDWIGRNLPPEARILISSTELRVLASDSFQGSVNGDAGAWITPLTDRATVPLPYHSDFSQQVTFDTLCQLEADYIYVGEKGTTFNNTLIESFPDRYQGLLSMPKVKIYQVVGCSTG
jgi:hypothetical protein